MTILATIVVLGVLIFVHELGHFLAAKAVGVDVQRFSIGLGPRVAGFTAGGTEYILSAIPLGGYVKMGGMDDEVMERIEGGAPQQERTPGPGDFDGKPIWARTLVISAGVIMNFGFAFLVYAGTMAVWGVQEAATTRVGSVLDELLPAGTEPLAGLDAGARIERIGDREIRHWGDVRTAFAEDPAGPTTLIQAEPSAVVEFRLPVSKEERGQAFQAIRYWLDPGVGAVNPGSPAAKAGIEPGDRIVSVDGRPVASWWDFVDEIKTRPGLSAELVLGRDGREVVRVVTPDAEEDVDPVTGRTEVVGRVGVYPPLDERVHESVPVTVALRYGYLETKYVTGAILGFLGDLVTGGVSARSVGSIVTIGNASGDAAARGLEAFLRFMALFSVNLAILNLLPIPILDGGHLLFLGIEAVRGRALSVEQRLKWSNVGFIIIMGIMLWALSNDVLTLLGL
ncbi:MAG TPA: RIP metalloprotease RseP [Longimicrobiales bacterium]|jgi:regulator of sigma E protease